MQISFRRSILAGSSPLLPALLMCLFSLPRSPGVRSGYPRYPLPHSLPSRSSLRRSSFAISAAGSFRNHCLSVSNSATPILPKSVLHYPTLNLRPGELFALRYTVKPYARLRVERQQSTLRAGLHIRPVAPAEPPPDQRPDRSSRDDRRLHVAHLKFRPLGLTPFLGAGGGTIRFTPTPGGGEGLPQQYRATYYYTAGVEGNFPDSHFGMRLGFRQLVYLAPDFLQNYLTITRRTISTEPTIGLFVRF